MRKFIVLWCLLNGLFLVAIYTFSSRNEVVVNNINISFESENEDGAGIPEDVLQQELEEGGVCEPAKPSECGNGICEPGEDYFSCNHPDRGRDCAKDPDFDFIYGEDGCVAISSGRLNVTNIVPDGKLLIHQNGRVYYRFCNLDAMTQKDFVAKLYRSLR